MTEIIYFTLAGIALYFVSDWILNRIEIMRGERFANRSLIFFAIILVLAMGLFNLIQHLQQGRQPNETTTENPVSSEDRGASEKRTPFPD